MIRGFVKDLHKVAKKHGMGASDIFIDSRTIKECISPKVAIRFNYYNDNVINDILRVMRKHYPTVYAAPHAIFDYPASPNYISVFTLIELQERCKRPLNVLPKFKKKG